jgi:resuscitation-promoting factor RpfB
MPGTVNGWTVGYAAVGGLVLWSGIAGTSLSATVKGALAGQSPSQLPDTEPITPATASAAGTGAPAASAPAGNTGAANSTAAANQAIAKVLAAPYGWSTGTQWDDLVSLWNAESGWSATAVNPTSGATGIPQLNPSAHAVPPGWSSATVQVTWGLAYIASTYGSPSAAWAHEESDGWY